MFDSEHKSSHESSKCILEAFYENGGKKLSGKERLWGPILRQNDVSRADIRVWEKLGMIGKVILKESV